jgi:hypothetical protein
MRATIWATSNLVHARKRDEHGIQIVGRTACGARTRRTDEDARVTCARCICTIERRMANATPKEIK